jgi:hypothetical protein
MNKTNYARSRLDAALDARACAEHGHDFGPQPDPVTGRRYCRRRCLAVQHADGQTWEFPMDQAAMAWMWARYGAASREVGW